VKRKRDYYEVLGVSKEATESDIKKAYRGLAKKYHPDRNPGDKHAEETFKEASEAYAVLADADKRVRYDRFGHQGVGGFGAEGFGGFNSEVFADLEDVLGSFFGFSVGDLFSGGRRRRGGSQRGADLRYDLEIEFVEAARGIEKELEIPRLEACGECRGTGSRKGSRSTCPACGGRGQTVHRQGFFTLNRPCGNCGGSGQLIKDPCPTCRGEGRRRHVRRIKVKIPPGVDTDMRLRVPGEGEGGQHGGRAGDLYVVIVVREHPQFRREGAHLLLAQPITISQAVLGADLAIPTLDGITRLNVPAGTQSGTAFRLRGKGLPRPNGGPPGDMYVTAEVSVPGRLTRKQRELYEKLAEVETPADAPPKDLLGRVRDIFN
jgi:molecular chaperone DnaJ